MKISEQVEQVKDRAIGCMLGQLAGDNLGALVEFRSAEQIAAEHGFGGPTKLRGGGTWNIMAGQPTDDSELALALARVLSKGSFGRPALEAYRRWYRSGPFDCGGTTRAALCENGQPDTVGQANGSLMRVSPFGIFAWWDPATAGPLAAADSRLTHANPVCAASCAAFAAAIARGIGGGDAFAMYVAAVRVTTVGCVRDCLTRAATERPANYAGWVLNALQNAFYQLLNAPTLEAGVVDTVRMGQDSDTNGCIAGALLGALHGAKAIPNQWRSAIRNCRPGPGTMKPRPREYWPCDAEELAVRLASVGVRL